MTAYEWISASLGSLGLIVSTIVLVFLLKQVKLLREQVRDARRAIDFATAEAEAENKRRRERATMDFIATTMMKLDENYDLVPAAGSADVDAYLKLASVDNTSEFRAIRKYLNYMEDLSVGLNLGLFDLEVVSRTIGPRMIRAWESYRPWIMTERHGLQTPTLFCDFEECVQTIAAHRSTTIAEPAIRRSQDDPVVLHSSATSVMREKLGSKHPS